MNQTSIIDSKSNVDRQRSLSHDINIELAPIGYQYKKKSLTKTKLGQTAGEERKEVAVVQLKSCWMPIY